MAKGKRTELLRSQVDLWFQYLKLADRLGYPVDWKFYRQWGTRKELRTMKFGTWWRERGEALFSEDRPSQIRVVSHGGPTVTLEIPAHWTVRRLRKEIGPVYAAIPKAPAPKGKGEFVLRGRYSYGDFVTYLRLLNIDLDATAAGRQLGMKDKLILLKKAEAERVKRFARATDKSREKALTAGRKKHRKFRVVTVSKPEQRNGYLWIKKGKRIAANVAKGEFPGSAA